MAGHTEGKMIAPCFLCMVLMRTLRSRLCYYPLKRTANQRLSMGQGVTAHKLTSKRVSILYPLTIRRLPGAATDIDDPQADSGQNSVWVSQWYLVCSGCLRRGKTEHFACVVLVLLRSCRSWPCPHSLPSE